MIPYSISKANYHELYDVPKAEGERAKISDPLAHLTMDRQQTMPLSCSSTSKAFHLRMWMCNFGTHILTK